MSAWHEDQWKQANDIPAVFRTQSFKRSEDSESAWFVGVQGNEFSIKLTLDDAELLAHRLTERAAEIRRDLAAGRVVTEGETAP